MSDVPPTDAIPPAEPTGTLPPIPPPAAPPAAPTPPPAPAAPSPTGGTGVEPWGWLSIVALVALLLGLFVEENESNLWDSSEAWSIFAIACALAVLAPLLRSTLKLSEERAWTVAAIGAGGLLLYWLLLVLPSISRNTSFAITVAAAAAVGAVWLAPGKRDLTR